MIRNEKALNNERRSFTVAAVEFRIASSYLEGSTPIALADETDLEAFLNELPAIIARITEIEAERTQRIVALSARVPTVPTTA